MLIRTFRHVAGIGPKTEHNLWVHGIRSWSDYISWAESPLDLNAPRYPSPPRPSRRVADVLRQSQAALAGSDAAFFGAGLPTSEHWRLVPEFSDSVAFLDVETTGLSKYYDELTVVGLFDGAQHQVFVRDVNLGDFGRAIGRFRLLVTFNGIQFDAPFLRAAIPGIELPPIHVDLRFLLARLGYRGPLKKIERVLDIGRDPESDAIDGRKAASLWFSHLRGDHDALERLLRYNAWDTINLASLLRFAYHAAREQWCAAAAVDGEAQGLPWSFRTSDIEATIGHAVRQADSRSPRAGKRRDSTRSSLGTLTKRAPEGSVIVGIDLSGGPSRRTGWARLEGTLAETRPVYGDDEIVETTLEANPTMVSIDSPLALPAGGSASGTGKIYRKSELELRRRGVSLFWCLLPTMVPLTMRGIRIAERLRAAGLQVIESFPGAAQDILRIPRKKAGTDALRSALIGFGVKGQLQEAAPTHDELDAITSAIVGLFFLAGEYEALGNEEEGYLIIPPRHWTLRQRTTAVSSAGSGSVSS